MALRFVLLLAAALASALTLPKLATGLGGYAYYTDPVFANALLQGGGWQIKTSGAADFVDVVDPKSDATRFDEKTLLPKVLAADEQMRLVAWGLHYGGGGERPSTWPRTASKVNGIFTLEWTGTAGSLPRVHRRMQKESPCLTLRALSLSLSFVDVRPTWCKFVANMSSGAETGQLKNGRRVYQCTENAMYFVTIHSMLASDALQSLAVWSPDPEAPAQRSLPNTTLFHPQFIKHLTTNAPNWKLFRFMDWLETNANTNRDWRDRNTPVLFSYSFFFVC